MSAPEDEGEPEVESLEVAARETVAAEEEIRNAAILEETEPVKAKAHARSARVRLERAAAALASWKPRTVDAT